MKRGRSGLTVRERREALGLSQAAAARRARVALATWRRYEDDPFRVRPETAERCQRALDAVATKSSSDEENGAGAARVAEAWANGPLTPRQAQAVMVTLDDWADAYLGPWLDEGSGEPLHECGPFVHFDLRCMMVIADNRAFAAMARERCIALSDEMQRGILPFERRGCYFDELLMAAVLHEAPELFNAAPEMFEGLPERPSRANTPEDKDTDDEDSVPGDDDWDWVEVSFDSQALWEYWQVPVWKDHHLVPAVLEAWPPYQWFDEAHLGPTLKDAVQHYLGLTEEEYRLTWEKFVERFKPRERRRSALEPRTKTKASE